MEEVLRVGEIRDASPQHTNTIKCTLALDPEDSDVELDCRPIQEVLEPCDKAEQCSVQMEELVRENSPVGEDDMSRSRESEDQLSPQVDPGTGAESGEAFSAPFITYEAVMWLIHATLVVLACVDRFTWNVWPRQNTFNINGHPAGWDKIDGLLDGPWSVKMYDVIVRVSGRFSILALNLMLFVKLRTVETWLATSWMGRRFIDCSNIVRANARLHNWNGYALVVLILMHVWSIFLPCIFHDYSAQLDSGPFEWPLSERRLEDFRDVDATKEMVSLQFDDIIRLCTVSVFLGLLAPLSVHWFPRYWNVAIQLHRLMAGVFCIEIIRRYAHPHSIILNTPVFFLWILDKIIFHIRGRSCLDQFQKIMLGRDYMVLLWRAGRASNMLAPNFYLKLAGSSVLEECHVFTAFQNRHDTKVPSVSGPWTTGMVIRVFRNKRRFSITKKERRSHTGRMADDNSAVIEAHGPYAGEMSELIVQALNGARSKCYSASLDDGPVVLVGTGSGINYLLDAIQYPFFGGNQLIILWSTGDSELFDWARTFVNEILTPERTNIKILLSNTRSKGGICSEDCCNSHPNIVRYLSGRIPYEKEVPSNSQVFFQGSKAVRNALFKACKRRESLMSIWKGKNFFKDKSLDQIAQKSIVHVNPAVSNGFLTKPSENELDQKSVKVV